MPTHTEKKKKQKTKLLNNVVKLEIIGTAVLTACIVLGLFLYWKHMEDEQKKEPANLENIQVVRQENGQKVLLTTGRHDISGNDTSYRHYHLRVVDPTNGKNLVDNLWAEEHDQPMCGPANPGRIWCYSRKLDLHLLDLTTLESTEQYFNLITKGLPSKQNAKFEAEPFSGGVIVSDKQRSANKISTWLISPDDLTVKPFDLSQELIDLHNAGGRMRLSALKEKNSTITLTGSGSQNRDGYQLKPAEAIELIATAEGIPRVTNLGGRPNCSGSITDSGTFGKQNAKGSRRSQLWYRAHGADTRTVIKEPEFIQPKFVCDYQTRRIVQIPNTYAVLVQHETSFISKRAQLQLSAITPTGEVLWKRLWPPSSNLVFATIIDDRLIVGLQLNPDDDRMFGLDLETGDILWDTTL